MAAIFRWGIQTGDWDAELRTDFELVNAGSRPEMNSGFQPKGLGDFSAVVIVSAEGDWGLRKEQKQALIDFVSQGGGLVVIHAGLNANRDWPEWAAMIGGRMAGHPFNTLDQPIRPFHFINEDPQSPISDHWPHGFVEQDEVYVISGFSRADNQVLLSLDPRSLDLSGLEDQIPPDHDFPVAWERRYGSGRVFVSSLGHTREAFGDPDIAEMYSQAIRWSLGLIEGQP